jgi:hypothetical protein
VELLESDALDDAVGSGESVSESVVSLLLEDPEQAATKKSNPKASSSVFQPIFSFLNNGKEPSLRHGTRLRLLT